MDIEELKRLIQGPNAYTVGYDPVSSGLQEHAKRLCWEYNRTSPDEGEQRRAILEELFGDCSPETTIEPDFRCDYGFNVHTEGLVFFNYNCTVLDTSPVRIGANTFVAPGVCLACASHPIDPEQRAQGIEGSAPITLEGDNWVGANAVVCGGATIGKGSVVGAGAVVTRDVPPGVVAGGVPCRVIREIGPQDRIDPASIAF